MGFIAKMKCEHQYIRVRRSYFDLLLLRESKYVCTLCQSVIFHNKRKNKKKNIPDLFFKYKKFSFDTVVTDVSLLMKLIYKSTHKRVNLNY